MRHLFQNEEGEVVAADTAEQAGRLHDCELGGDPEIVGEWTQIPDDQEITMTEEPEPPKKIKKTAAEWAADYMDTAVVSSTYC